MCRTLVRKFFITTLYIICIIISGSSSSHGNLIDNKVLNVGEELWRETLPLRMGSRLYQLQGLKPNTWYEVKISYPASIPASFSIQLKRGDLELPLNGNRRLLNTEKLIFKSESDGLNDQGGVFVLVTVEPEGVVAIPNVQKREYIIFNIVCDELLLGIPHQAWWVVGCVGVFGFGLHHTVISTTLFVKSSQSECFERFLNMTETRNQWLALSNFTERYLKYRFSVGSCNSF